MHCGGLQSSLASPNQLRKRKKEKVVRTIKQPVMGTFVRLKQINFKSQRIYIFIHIQLVPQFPKPFEFEDNYENCSDNLEDYNHDQ